MGIADIISFFEEKAKEAPFNHTEDVPAFFEFDFEDILSALKGVSSFPVMFVKTPEISKTGISDNLIENIECAVMVIDTKANHDNKKAALTNYCKSLTDQIFNSFILKLSEMDLSGVESDEGIAGPFINQDIYGWISVISFQSTYGSN